MFGIASRNEVATHRQVARALEARGHDIAVYEGPWRGWLDAFAAARLFAARNAELAVVEGPRSFAMFGWARLLHPSTTVTGLAATDAEAAERELEGVRSRAHRYRRAVFLDRDGTLMPEIGALGRPEAVRLMPGVAPALRALQAGRYELVVVSNQSAIGRGAVTAEQVTAVNAALRRALRAEGVELAGLFLCPHRPEDGCDCRKPLPGLLLQAATALDLSLARSWLVGDSTRDTQAAARAGVRGILLQTGWGGGDPAAPDDASAPRPVRDIAAATRAILRG